MPQITVQVPSHLGNMSQQFKASPHWKTSQVMPIFREGNKADITCYRPISLLCFISKVLEKILLDEVYGFFRENNPSKPVQFFKTSITDNSINYLLDQINDCIDLNSLEELIVLYLDFSKTFDTVFIKCYSTN